MNINEYRWINQNEPEIKENQLLLIDADIIYNRAAFSVENKWDFGGDPLHTTEDADVIALFNNLLHGLTQALNSTRFILFWTLDKNFRYDIYPLYKANRDSVRRPTCSSTVKKSLQHRYPSVAVNGLEADDLMGLYSGDNSIIVSDDKDMLTVPGLHYRPRKPDMGIFSVTEEEADAYLLTQVLTGDRIDGYPGIKGVGPKKAEKILSESCTWARVVRAYLDYGLSYEDAIINGRLARILRPGEYNWKTNEPILWNPKK